MRDDKDEMSFIVISDFFLIVGIMTVKNNKEIVLSTHQSIYGVNYHEVIFCDKSDKYKTSEYTISL